AYFQCYFITTCDNRRMARNRVDMLKIENVSKKFEGRTVLKNVTATLSTGRILGLIGKSAAGKSVLIHMIRGTVEYAPDEGKVLYHVNRCCKCGHLDVPFEGEACSKCGGETETIWIDFWALPERDPLRQELKGRISIMLQRTFALFGDATVMENILEAIGTEVSERERIDRTIELLSFVNMTHRTTHIARDLSGGEKQRVVLARQLAKNPLFFLADEPTGTLDPYTAEIVHDRLVKYVRENNVCMIFASHWPEAIDRMADEAIWLDAGNVIAQDDPKKVTSKFMEDYHFEKQAATELGEPFIVVDNAKKHYFSVVRGVVKAVDGVSFDIKENEVFALVGLSGAGKTTTSRMIAGMTPATSGSVKIKIGEDWIDMSESGFMGKGRATPYIGFLHQEYTLYPFDTVLRNLTACIGMKMPAELARVKAVQVLLSVGFSDDDVEKVLFSYPDSLSVGECQRIAFAQVLIKEPRIVILDEPTGTMDPITKVTVAKAVLKARKDLGETFIVVSHDMDFIVNCCDRAVLMEGGKIVTIGRPEEIVSNFDNIEKKHATENGE
ncbi:MAG: methyl coenzyme M reductase system, component A2, partial [Candidatus Methanomethylophilaceae archaeon]